MDDLLVEREQGKQKKAQQKECAEMHGKKHKHSERTLKNTKHRAEMHVKKRKEKKHGIRFY